jgi:hypothetical protein
MKTRVVREREDSVESTDDLDAKIAQAAKLLPAWFVPRMMSDAWLFGLMLVTGKTVPVRQIVALHKDAAGDIWIDAKMVEGGMTSQGLDLLVCASGRPAVSLNARHVVGALELSSV